MSISGKDRRASVLELAFAWQSRALLVLLIIGVAACSDDPAGLTGLRCGDTVCSSTETPEDCPQDCSFDCIPGTARCDGNALVICLDDGVHEEVQSCEAEEVCRVDACVVPTDIDRPVPTDTTGADMGEIVESDADRSDVDLAPIGDLDMSSDADVGVSDASRDPVDGGDPEEANEPDQPND